MTDHRKGLTFIGRHGQVTRVPDASDAAVQDALEGSGLEDLLRSGSPDPMKIMSALAGLHRDLGIERRDMTPDEIAEDLFPGLSSEDAGAEYPSDDEDIDFGP